MRADTLHAQVQGARILAAASTLADGTPSMAHATIYINGKYLAQGLTGVQRVAGELVQALDRLLGEQRMDASATPAPHWVLLHPRSARPPALRCIEPRPLGPAAIAGHLWEQLLLPWAARDGHLINLAGSAPWMGRRQTAMIHDAAVFDHPEAYTRSFVRWYRALFRHLCARATPLLTPSAFSADRLQHWLAPTQLTLLPGSGDHFLAIDADTAVLTRLDLLERPFFLAVASANPTKNLAALRRAYAAYAEAAAHDRVALVLVGGRNARVFRDASSAPRQGGLIEAGPVSDAELKALYQRALALVFPSIYEGFGIPPLEAMHCGCPVIAARAASLPEVCADAVHYIAPDDPASISAALRRISGDAAYRAQLRDAGRARAARFSWAASAQRLLALMTQPAPLPGSLVQNARFQPSSQPQDRGSTQP